MKNAAEKDRQNLTNVIHQETTDTNSDCKPNCHISYISSRESTLLVLIHAAVELTCAKVFVLRSKQFSCLVR